MNCSLPPDQDIAGLLREIITRLDRLEKAQSLSVVKDSYTTKEVAERLGCSEWTVRQWCNLGQVPDAVKKHGRGRTGEWKIPHEALLRLQDKGPLPLPPRQRALRQTAA